MKYSFLLLVLLLSSLLTACTDKSSAGPHAQAVSSSTLAASQQSEADTSVLEEFVNAINYHQVDEALDLFNDGATLTEVEQFNPGTTLPQTGWAYSHNGKAEIGNWLEYHTQAITQIVPVEYKVATNTVTLEAVFYYATQVQTIRVDAHTQAGRFNSLYLYVEKVKFAFMPNNTSL